jgi:hypothetical protein
VCKISASCMKLHIQKNSNMMKLYAVIILSRRTAISHGFLKLDVFIALITINYS